MNKVFVLLFLSFVIFLFSQFVGVRANFYFFNAALSPLESVLAKGGQEFNSFFGFVFNIPKVFEENKTLKIELAKLDSLVSQNKVLSEENVILRKQLGEKQKGNSNFEPCQVLGSEQRGDTNYYLLNKGSDDGIKIGMPVVLTNTLLGKVAEVTNNQSLFLPVTAPQISIPVEIRDTSGNALGKGLASGEYNLNVLVDRVLPDVKLGKDNIILTSGDGGTFPGGLVIGRVESVHKKDNEVFQWAEVRPYIDLNSLGLVFVVIN